jgi:hypothetical protein
MHRVFVSPLSNIKSTTSFLGRPSSVSRSFSATARASQENMSRPRRFAPLDPAKKRDGDTRPVLRGIVFDVDGTLCEFNFLPDPCSVVIWRYVSLLPTSSSQILHSTSPQHRTTPNHLSSPPQAAHSLKSQQQKSHVLYPNIH